MINLEVYKLTQQAAFSFLKNGFSPQTNKQINKQTCLGFRQEGKYEF